VTQYSALRYVGFLDVPIAGPYDFTLTAADGALLFLDDQSTPFIDSRGAVHRWKDRTHGLIERWELRCSRLRTCTECRSESCGLSYPRSSCRKPVLDEVVFGISHS